MMPILDDYAERIIDWYGGFAGSTSRKSFTHPSGSVRILPEAWCSF